MTARDDRAAMRPFAALATWDEARAVAEQLAVPVPGREDIAIQRSAGRVLAADVIARVDVPSADRAAMDGYAVRAADCAGGGTLRRLGRLAAGETASVSVEAGGCIEIATGAPIPAGADAVVPVEATVRDGETVRCSEAVGHGDHISRQGTDLTVGLSVACSGDRVTAALLAACVAGGVETVSVWQRPRVLIAPTGDEVVSLGHPLPAGKVYDSNAAGLMALLEEIGAEPEHAGIVVDDTSVLVEVLSGSSHDMVVTIGGTSVGRRDLVADAIARVGRVVVHGVAVRPGKPLLLGTVDGRTAVGLPGFPTTCMMLAYALLDPMLRRIARRPDRRPQTRARLATDLRSPLDKAQLLPVRLDGESATPTFTFSSAVSSMARASGWIEIPAGVDRLAVGADVEVHRF